MVLGGGIAAALVVLFAIDRSQRRAKLSVSAGELVFSGPFRARRLLGDGRHGRVIHVDVVWPFSGRVSRLWLLANKDGEAEVVLNRAAWDEAELEAFRAEIGVSLDVLAQPMRPADLRRTYLGSVAWWAVHPVIVALLVIVLVAAMLVVANS